MEILTKLVVTFVLVGLLTVVIGVICGAVTGFVDNWALKVAGAGFCIMLGSMVLALVGALVHLWL